MTNHVWAVLDFHRQRHQRDTIDSQPPPGTRLSEPDGGERVSAVRVKRPEETSMISIFRQRAVTVVAGAVALYATMPAVAAPVLSNTAAVKSAVAGDVIDVRWRGYGVAAGVAAGLAIGALAGAAWRPYYYDSYYYAAPGYAYPGYAYGGGYAYDPGYSYYRPVQRYDSSGAAVGSSGYYCPPGAAVQNRC